ncbi:adhesion G-protein coupled receptor G7 isoform X2 [Chiloscyllium plagiosum]|uniref:adhesion G-protein coupled receptor G7 isoform X2 n=1 Tax=Chiloscyllium plagiosum TaxID=36176 RepID=UPI001CB8143D|nr:adhesion G-protein coupled receptor G7 isoform X2 [Chiloscyllium plagiosum]
MLCLQCDCKVLLGVLSSLFIAGLWGACFWKLAAKFKSDSSMKPSSLSPANPQSCYCQNNGTCENEICVCPDEWKGDHSNFCEKSEYNSSQGLFTFHKILVGCYGYSQEECEPYTLNANISKASRLCTEKNGIISLQNDTLTDCNVNLKNLSEKITKYSGITEEELVKIAMAAQMLTSEPHELTSENISLAAQIVQNILNQSDTLDSVEAASLAINTISQLLNVNETAFDPTNKDIFNITQSVTQILGDVLTDLEISFSQVVQPNLAASSIILQNGTTHGIMLSVLKGHDDTLVSNRIELNTNATKFLLNTNAEVQMFVNVSTNSTQDGKLGIILYQNDKFFQSKVRQCTNNQSRQVISGTIAEGVLNGVELLFNPKYNSAEYFIHDHACVFWDYDMDDWNTAGCSKSTDEFGYLRCQCNHATNFAVFMSFRRNYNYTEPLNIVTYVGCGFSILGLAITIVFQIITRQARKTSLTWVTVSLCISMLMVNLIFIFGINNSNALNEKNAANNTENIILPSDHFNPPEVYLCTAAAAILHYFLMATFTWSALYGAQMYVLLVHVFKPLPRHFLIWISVVGWGLPAVIVITTFTATYKTDDALNYRQEEFCWLSGFDLHGNLELSKPMLWGFLLPVAILLLFNFVMFALVTMLVLYNKDHGTCSAKQATSAKKMMGSLSVAVVLCLTWSLGYLMLIEREETQAVFSYLFCALNATQGLQIFILFTARRKAFQKMYAAWDSRFDMNISIVHSKKFSFQSVSIPENRELYTVNFSETSCSIPSILY